MENTHKKPRAVSTFAGAGGLSLGLKMAGWQIDVAIEFDEHTVATYRHNFPSTDVLLTDVRDVDFTQFRGVHLVAGGPPCQPFSVAGKQLAEQDPRDMVPEFIRAVREAEPRAFLLENVPGLVSRRHRDYRAWLVRELRSLGYRVYEKILNAASYGVPQRRRRVFFLGVPHGTLFAFPKPTHGPEASQPYVTAGEALADAPHDTPNGAKVTYAKNPVLRRSPFAGMLVNGAGRPIDLDRPANTLPATAGGNRTHIVDRDGVLLEYHKHLTRGGKPRSGEVRGVRRLTLPESARLQSFPDSFVFLGPKSSRYRQVGNAVPPLLGKAIGEAVYKALFCPESINAPTQLPIPEPLLSSNAYEDK